MTVNLFDAIAAAAAKMSGAKLILTTEDGKSWKRWTAGGCSTITDEEIEQQCIEHRIDYELLLRSRKDSAPGPVGVTKWEAVSTPVGEHRKFKERWGQ